MENSHYKLTLPLSILLNLSEVHKHPQILSDYRSYLIFNFCRTSDTMTFRYDDLLTEF